MAGTFLVLPLVVAGTVAVGAAVRTLTAEADRLNREVRRLGDLRPALVELRQTTASARRRPRNDRLG